jgi:hypothetical protein
MSVKRKIPSLVIEYISDASNLYCLSMIEHHQEQYLAVIDNIVDTTITAYVLDYAEQEGVDLNVFIDIVKKWSGTHSNEYPLSFELSRLGLSNCTKNIYKTFDMAHVTRLVGRSFEYNFTVPLKVRRKRVTCIPCTPEIIPRASIIEV